MWKIVAATVLIMVGLLTAPDAHAAEPSQSTAIPRSFDPSNTYHFYKYSDLHHELLYGFADDPDIFGKKVKFVGRYTSAPPGFVDIGYVTKMRCDDELCQRFIELTDPEVLPGIIGNNTTYLVLPKNLFDTVGKDIVNTCSPLNICYIVVEGTTKRSDVGLIDYTYIPIIGRHVKETLSYIVVDKIGFSNPGVSEYLSKSFEGLVQGGQMAYKVYSLLPDGSVSFALKLLNQ